MSAAVENIDIEQIRKAFPILQEQVNGKPLIYFDNAATTQKPKTVIDALGNYYSHYNANIHRGIHTLAEKATSAYEDTREAIKTFINAGHKEEVIFTKGTTEGLNLITSTYGRHHIKKGDEIIISAMEHHSNIVPWQMLCEEKEAILKVIPVTDKGEIIFDEYQKLLCEKTKIVSIVHVSNALGTINPIKKMIQAAHSAGAIFVVDGAQASSHLTIDVKSLDCDFYAFSGHKMYGPTGIGILYGKKNILEDMPPYQGGGEMIEEVSFEKTTYNELPYKFEAGTPNIADAIALKNAVTFINEIGKENIIAHENAVLHYAQEKLQKISIFKPVGTSPNKTGVISFTLDGFHHFDIGMMLDTHGIAVRTGHHCTQPLMNLFNIEGTIRASFAIYNTKSEVDQLISSIERIIKTLKK